MFFPVSFCVLAHLLLPSSGFVLFASSLVSWLLSLLFYPVLGIDGVSYLSPAIWAFHVEPLGVFTLYVGGAGLSFTHGVVEQDFLVLHCSFGLSFSCLAPPLLPVPDCSVCFFGGGHLVALRLFPVSPLSALFWPRTLPRGRRLPLLWRFGLVLLCPLLCRRGFASRPSASVSCGVPPVLLFFSLPSGGFVCSVTALTFPHVGRSVHLPQHFFPTLTPSSVLYRARLARISALPTPPSSLLLATLLPDRPFHPPPSFRDCAVCGPISPSTSHMCQAWFLVRFAISGSDVLGLPAPRTFFWRYTSFGILPLGFT